ncbi:MAG: VanZ family protein [Dysgonamonadaceae bacterium]|jgi:VanZ family protein|nr:VanZ family protein [Dysgonamonadaceae bacterium]
MIILKKYWISIVFVAVILTLCFVNPPEFPVKIPMTNLDKLVHFLMFMGLSGVVFYDNSFRFKQKVTGWLFLGGSFLFPIAFSGGIEIAQEYLTATRSGDWMDFLCDMLGVSCGCLVCWLINRRIISSAQ